VHPVSRRLLHAPTALYRARLGFLLGHRFLLLVHAGRRTGRRYETVVEVVRWDPAAREAVVMSGWGRRASWFRNVEAGGALEIATGRDRFDRPEHRILGDEEAARVLAEYERRNRIAAPVVRLVLSRLAGFDYDASPSARLRLVRTLPLVGFRPRS
jgi:deazaflavin-dependent oxidoreductase (nitroreductase family)